MFSKYNSFCVACKGRIRIGDPIKKVGDKWVHEKCPIGKKSNFEQLVSMSSSVKEEEISVSFSEEKEFIPSPYQQAVFDFIKSGTGNAAVEAVAGSGKTTTIVKAIEIIPKNSRVAFLAFNKHIVKELDARCKRLGLTNVHVSTIHSLGFQVCRKLADLKRGKDAIDEDKLGGIMDEFWPIASEFVKDESQKIQNRMKRGLARKIVSLLKATLTDYDKPSSIISMMERYGIEVDEKMEVLFGEILENIPRIMKASIENVSTIDYDDMVYLPLVHPRLKTHFELFDFILVDEAQDLNASQVEFILRSIYKGGRIVVVGDRKQSLYGFRGADTEAIPKLIERLNATVLPLSISYRCPKIHIERAKTLVPQIEASPDAKEGKFAYLEYNKFMKMVEPGDMVVCRTNAPLVKPAFAVIRSGKKATIRGKDIGKQLVNLVERFETNDLSSLEVMLNEYLEKEYSRLIDRGKELAADMLRDKVETIYDVAKECKNVVELTNKLDMLFSDSTVGVTFSSVHRAKGLEAERVFILKPELMPHPRAKQDWELQQEDNTLYVAITRSKDELYYVEGEQ